MKALLIYNYASTSGVTDLIKYIDDIHLSILDIISKTLDINSVHLQWKNQIGCGMSYVINACVINAWSFLDKFLTFITLSCVLFHATNRTV